MVSFVSGNQGKPLESVEIYDIEKDEWTSGKEMPVAHCSCAYIVHESKLHVIGGLSTQGPTSCMESIRYRTKEEEEEEEKEKQKNKRAGGKGGKKR